MTELPPIIKKIEYNLLTQPAEAAQLIEEYGTQFYQKGQAQMVFAWLERLQRELSPELLLLKGLVLDDTLARHADARECFNQAEQIFEQQNNPEGLVRTKVRQSTSFRVAGDGRKSLELIQQAFKLMDSVQIPNLHIHALAIRSRGLSYSTIGKVPEAMTDLIQSLDLFKKLDDIYYVGYSHYDIGICLVKQGQIREAEHHYQRSIQIWQELENINRLANSLNSLGVSFCLLGDFDEALRVFKRCIEIATEIDSTRPRAFALAGIGDVYLSRQEYTQAIDFYKQSTELAASTGVQSLEIYNRIKLSECIFEQDDLRTAERMIRHARNKADEIGLVVEVGMAFLVQARIHLKQGKFSCIGLFKKAISFLAGDELEEAKAKLWLAYALMFPAFRDSRPIAALDQLHSVLSFIANKNELVTDLRQITKKTQPLLIHFSHWPNGNNQLGDSIKLLLQKLPDCQPEIEIQVRAFGQPQIANAGKLWNFSAQTGAVGYIPEFLLYFILEGRGRVNFLAEQICKILWPGLEKGNTYFKQIVQRLRSEGVQLKQENYRYQLVANYWCDVLAFEALFFKTTTLSPVEALPLQREIIYLYRGDFLEGLELSPWGEAYRADLREKYLQTVKLAKGVKR